MKSRTVLTSISLTQPNSGDVRDRVRFVGRFERTREQVLFADWLVAFPWVDARTAKVKQPFHAVQAARVNDGRVDHQVVIDEFRRPRAVRQNSPNCASCEENVLRPVRRKPGIHGCLIAQVNLGARRPRCWQTPQRLAGAPERNRLDPYVRLRRLQHHAESHERACGESPSGLAWRKDKAETL